MGSRPTSDSLQSPPTRALIQEHPQAPVFAALRRGKHDAWRWHQGVPRGCKGMRRKKKATRLLRSPHAFGRSAGISGRFFVRCAGSLRRIDGVWVSAVRSTQARSRPSGSRACGRSCAGARGLGGPRGCACEPESRACDTASYYFSFRIPAPFLNSYKPIQLRPVDHVEPHRIAAGYSTVKVNQNQELTQIPRIPWSVSG